MSIRARPNTRARVEGRTTRQEQQKQDSRERILDAAKKVVAQRNYALIAIEDIIAEAEVSRATFYRHFDSRYGIFMELHRPFLKELYDIHDTIGKKANPSLMDIRKFLKALLSFYTRERILALAYHQIMAIEPEFQPVLQQLVAGVTSRLGKNIAAFHVAESDDPRAERARVEARFLLNEIDYFCVEVAVYKWSVNIELAINIIAEKFLDFVKKYGPS